MSGYGCSPAIDHTQPAAVSSESTWPSRPGCHEAAPSVVIQSEPALLQAYPTSGEANRMCATPAGGPGSRVHLAPPSVVVTSSPLPSAQPRAAETKLTSRTSTRPAAGVLWGKFGGLVAAVAEGLAVTGTAGAAGDCTEPALDDPQPATATSATSAASAAAVTGKRLLISPGRRSPLLGCLGRSVPKTLAVSRGPAAYWGHGPDYRDNPRREPRHLACRHGGGRARCHGQDVSHHRADRDGRRHRRVARGRAHSSQLTRRTAPLTGLGPRGGACRGRRCGPGFRAWPAARFRESPGRWRRPSSSARSPTSRSRTSRACLPRWAPAGSRTRGPGSAGRGRSRRSPGRVRT